MSKATAGKFTDDEAVVITRELAWLLKDTSDHDVREASEAWARRDHVAAFDALAAAEETFESREDDDNRDTAAWLREEIDALS